MIAALFLFILIAGGAAILGDFLGRTGIRPAVAFPVLFIYSLMGSLLVVVALAHADDSAAMARLRESSVRVEGLECSGSGSIVEAKSGKTYLLTNAHVCLCAGYGGDLYAVYDNGELVKARITKRDWGSDLCAARLRTKRKALKLGPKILPNMNVSTRGYPHGRLVESRGQVGGMVAWDIDFEIGMMGECPPGSMKDYGLNGSLQACRMHFVSVTSNLYGRPGGSGSPVVDDNGDLVGVISAFQPGVPYDARQTTYEQTKSFLEAL